MQVVKIIVCGTNPIVLLFIIIIFEIRSIVGTESTNDTDRNNKNDDPTTTNVTKVFNETEILSDVTQQSDLLSTTIQTTGTPTPVHLTDTDNRSVPTSQANFCKCGIASFASGKIVGGTPVNEQNYWPWFATLVRVDQLTKVHCGASLISRRYLLTAAHCLLPMMQLGLRHFKVKLGYHELLEKGSNGTSNEKHDQFDVPIESVTLHPLYQQSFPYHYDIGVVKLSSAINCTHRIRPICLPSSDPLENEPAYSSNETAITVGFGRTSVNGNHSRVLQQIHLKLISMNECNHSFSKLPFKAPELMDNMICAWGKGKDTCVGDSGGPLFLWRTSANAIPLGRSDTASYFEQVGVTSWGVGCANDKYAGVYSRVDKYLTWLKSVVNYDFDMIMNETFK